MFSVVHNLHHDMEVVLDGMAKSGNNAVAGAFPVDGGQIIIDGTDVTKLPEHKRAIYLGRVFQDPMTGTAASMQIEENMALAARRGLSRTLKKGISSKEREFYRERLAELGLGLEDDVITKSTRINVLKVEQEGNVGFIVDEVKEVVTLSSREIEKITYNAKEDNQSLINAVGKYNGDLISLFDLNAISLEG